MAMRPQIPNLTLSRRWRIALAVVGVIIVLLIVASSLTGVYINWLWFGELGYRKVYRGILLTRIWLFLIFGALMALIIGGNLLIAYLLRPPFRPMSAEQQNLERYRVMVEPRKRLILIAVMVLAFFTAGMSAQGRWQTWLLWLHGGSFGVADPQFHRDISFFAWDYPAYRTMLGFGFTAVLFTLILSVGVHYLTGAIRLQTPGPKVTPAARRHLTVLVFVFVTLKAVAYWLDRYGLDFSHRSVFTGASYTDVHASLQAKTILFWLAIIIAAGVLASVATQRDVAGHRLRGAPRAQHPDQRHLPGDRPAGFGEAEREHQGSRLHQPQHPGDEAGVRDRDEQRAGRERSAADHRSERQGHVPELRRHAEPVD